jgi:histidinol phosphatase-like enzyme
MSRRGVFLDLNGTLVLPAAPAPLSEYRPIGNASQAVGYLCRAGFVCPVVTVQSGIAKGRFTETAFREWFESFKRELAIRGASWRAHTSVHIGTSRHAHVSRGMRM